MKSSRQKVSRVALVVLGMHRSGTSALAGALTLLGCDGPATPMKPTADNAKGYFEPAPLYPLHSKLLDSAASSWDDWLPVGTSWLNSVRAEEFQTRAAALIQEQFGTSRLFVLKDPRICRLVPFWARVLEEMNVTPRYILTHRNPLEVAQSLNKRDGMEIEVALLIWLRHVLDAEAATRGKRRCFTSYAELMTNWSLVGHKIEDRLKVALPRLSPQVAGELEDFLSGELRHQNVTPEKALTDARTAGWVQTVFAILEKWVAEGESAADFDTLDEVRRQFDASAGAYARPLRLMQSVQNELKKLGSDTARWTEEKEKLAREVETLRAERARTMADIESRLQQQTAQQQGMLKAAQEAAKAELAEKTAAFTEGRERQNAAIQQARAERDRIAEERKELAAKFESLRTSRAELEEKLKERTAALEAERRKAATANEAQGKAHEARIAGLEMELAVTRGALDERRMTAAQTETALAELRDRLMERETTHERALAALKGDLEQRLRESETALTDLRGEVSQRTGTLEQEKAALEERLQDRIAALRQATEARNAQRLRNEQLQASLAATKEALKTEVQARDTALAEAASALEGLRAEKAEVVAGLESTLAELRAALDDQTAATRAAEEAQALALSDRNTQRQRNAQLRETLAATKEALKTEVQARDTALAEAASALEGLRAEQAEIGRASCRERVCTTV